MHLLAAKPGGYVDDEGIVDLDQSPGDVVILAAADSLLAGLADAVDDLPAEYPSIRLANWLQLQKPAAFDLYQDKVLERARVVLVSLLGGENYWRYGCERLVDWAAEDAGRRLLLVPGDDTPDPALFELSTVSVPDAHRAWRFLREGGADNLRQLFYWLGSEYLRQAIAWREPRQLPRCLLYMPGASSPATFDDWQARWQRVNPAGETGVLLFYRSHL